MIIQTSPISFSASVRGQALPSRSLSSDRLASIDSIRSEILLQLHLINHSYEFVHDLIRSWCLSASFWSRFARDVEVSCGGEGGRVGRPPAAAALAVARWCLALRDPLCRLGFRRRPQHWLHRRADCSWCDLCFSCTRFPLHRLVCGFPMLRSVLEGI